MKLFVGEWFKQSEQIELLLYGLFGLFIACIPFLFKVFPYKNELFGNIRQIGIFKNKYFIKYAGYLSISIGLMTFSGLLKSTAGGLEGEMQLLGYSVYGSNGKTIELLGLPLFLMVLILYGFSEKIYNKHESKVVFFAIALPFVLYAVLININTAFFTLPELSLGVHFHHWGAYISAAKSLNAGLLIFNDFPSQYGLGPTLIIAMFSSFLGWVEGMFYAIGLMQFLYWMSLSVIALKLVGGVHGNKKILWIFAFTITTVGCFFWIPEVANYSNQAPSLGGTRFLPATFFVAIVLSLNCYSDNITKQKIWLLHAMWALCALWSIESAFYVSLIWWPYYVFIRVPETGSIALKAQNVIESIRQLLLVVAILILVFIFVYWAVYSDLPLLSVYTVFIENIPGSLLIELTGPFYFIVSIFVMSIGGWLYIYPKQSKSREFHNTFLVILLTYAAFSYYIGRSHTYNVLPLIPFFSILLLSTCGLLYPVFVRYFSITLLCMLISWGVLNQSNQNYQRFDIVDFNGDQLNSIFKDYREDPTKTDLGRAISYINDNFSESAIAVDPVSTVTLSGNQEQWNSYNNMASYNYLPNPMQKEFIEKLKNKLMKPGWVLVHKNMGVFGEVFILDLFKKSYDLTERIQFGEYLALRFKPKVN